LGVADQLADHALGDAARRKLCAAVGQIIRMVAKGVDHRPLHQGPKALVIGVAGESWVLARKAAGFHHFCPACSSACKIVAAQLAGALAKMIPTAAPAAMTKAQWAIRRAAAARRSCAARA
jgi:hypothetical protein